MRNEKIIMLFFFLFTGFACMQGQDLQWKETSKQNMAVNLNSLAKYLKNKLQYQVLMTDASYADYNTEIPHEKSNGYVKREGMKFHNFMMGVHTIQNDKYRLVVDTARKIFIIADPLTTINDVISDTAYNFYLKVCDKIKVARAGNLLYFKFEFNDKYRLTSMLMTIRDSLVEKVVMYYRHEVKSNNKSGKPRVEITFEKWKTSVDNAGEAFSTDNYIYKKENKYYLKPAYADKYKLLDQRVFTKSGKS